MLQHESNFQKYDLKFLFNRFYHDQLVNFFTIFCPTRFILPRTPLTLSLSAVGDNPECLANLLQPGLMNSLPLTSYALLLDMVNRQNSANTSLLSHINHVSKLQHQQMILYCDIFCLIFFKFYRDQCKPFQYTQKLATYRRLLFS